MSGAHERHSRIALIGAGLQSTGSAIARGFPVSIAYADDFDDYERQQISTATVNNSMTVDPQGNRHERRARRARSRRK